MAVILCAAMAIGVAAACVAPIYYFKETAKSADDDDIRRPRIVVSQHESVESPQFHIQIRHPPREKLVKAVSPRLRDKTLVEKSLGNEPVNSAKSESKLEGCDCPASLSRNTTNKESTGDRRRRLGNFLSWRRYRRKRRAAADNPDIDRNNATKGSNKTGTPFYKDNTSVDGISSSSETGNCGVTQVVTVQIETPTECQVPPTHETPPRTQETGNLEEQTSPKSTAPQHKLTPLMNILSNKFRNFKRSLQRNKMRDVSSFKEMPEGRSTCRTPVGHSTVLPKRRMIDRRSNLHDKSSDSKRVSYLLLNDGQTGNEGMKIIGLRVSQAELLSGTNDGHNTALLVAEEESVISIGFHEDRHGQQDLPASSECVMQKLYRSLPVRFEGSAFSRLFRSQRRSRSQSLGQQHETRRNVDSGISNDVSDETSYVSFPGKSERTARRPTDWKITREFQCRSNGSD